MKKENAFILKGFTLIELLISISIFSAIALVMYSSFRAGTVSWRRIKSELDIQQKMRHALDTMNSDFKNMIFLSDIPFEGNSDSMKFISFIKSADGMGANIGRINYRMSYRQDSPSKMGIIRQEESLRGALYVGYDEDENIKKAKAIREENLPDFISGIKFSYLLASKGIKEGEEIKYEWLDSWEAKDALPLGIAVELTLNFPEENREVKLARRIYIPTGKVKEKEEILPNK